MRVKRVDGTIISGWLPFRTMWFADVAFSELRAGDIFKLDDDLPDIATTDAEYHITTGYSIGCLPYRGELTYADVIPLRRNNTMHVVESDSSEHNFIAAG